jgi:hypothetical protein
MKGDLVEEGRRPLPSLAMSRIQARAQTFEKQGVALAAAFQG